MDKKKKRKKRAHGEGTVYQRADGRWCGQLAVTLPDGRLVRKTVYGKTQREVREKLDELRRQFRQFGVVAADARTTVAAYAAAWLDANRTRLRPQTLRTYQTVLTHMIEPELGRLRLSALTPVAIEQWLTRLEQRYERSTVRKARAVLGRILRDAERDALIARNPVELARPVSVQRRVHDVWTPDETKRFLACADTHWLGPLFRFLLATGVRVGEALGLSWEDVDLDTGTVLVRWQLQRVAGQWLRHPPKSERGNRSLPLNELARAALARQRDQQAAWRATPGWVGNAWQLVFTRPDGRPLAQDLVYKPFVHLCEQAGVPRVRLHDLRHALATYLLAAGVDLKTVSELLGHSRIGVTGDIYAHVTRQLLTDAVQRLDDIFSPLQ